MNKLYILILTSAVAFGAAYKLPEQSLDSTALSGANIANCDGADCALFNSANSLFLDPNSRYISGGLIYIHLPEVKYEGTQNVSGNIIPANGESEVENIIVPYFHYVSKEYSGFRYTLSATVPGGLSKRWETPVQKMYAKEFTLKTIQVNPSVAYRVNSNFAVSAGVDIVYSEGKVYSDGNDLNIPIKREMEGDSIDFGYNLAATYHFDSGVNLAITYRSKIDLTEEGNANLYLGTVGNQYKSNVTIYQPAALNLAISKRFNRLDVELNYERTFWSSYKYLDFNYDKPILSPILYEKFDKPKNKFWRDTNTFRVGLKYHYSDKLTLMGGYSYDQSPIKDEYVSYELPDSNAHIFSAGFKYKHNSNLTWGLSALYDYKAKREVTSQENGIDGKFSEGGAMLITAGVEYKF